MKNFLILLAVISVVVFCNARGHMLQYEEDLWERADEIGIHQLGCASDQFLCSCAWFFLDEDSQSKLMAFANEFYSVEQTTLRNKSEREQYQRQLFGFKLGRDFRDDYDVEKGIQYLKTTSSYNEKSPSLFNMLCIDCCRWHLGHQIHEG